MKQQWSNLVSPGCTVKVKVKDKLASAVVENCYYISKVSFDNLYCYATAKADVRLPDSRLIRELQFSVEKAGQRPYIDSALCYKVV